LIVSRVKLEEGKKKKVEKKYLAIDPEYSEEITEEELLVDPITSMKTINLPNLIKHNFSTKKHFRGSKSVRIERYTNRIRKNPALSLYYNNKHESFDIEKLKAYHYLNRLKRRAKNMENAGHSQYSLKVGSRDF